MYKILVFGMTPNRGGMESVVVNFFRHMDKEKFHLDFICNRGSKIGFGEEFDQLSKNPIQYHQVPIRRKNPLLYEKTLRKILKEGQYDAVWINSLMMMNLKNMKLAKKYGVKKIILHSHNAGGPANSPFMHLMHKVNRQFINRYATDLWSCSDEATDWMFPKRLHSKVEWIRNAIDVKQFLFDDDKRQQLRNELGIAEDEFVIGNIARMDPQKNQEFILKVFSEVVKHREKSKLVLVGGGDASSLKEQAKNLGIQDKILFLGMRSDVNDLCNIFDFFLFPSKYEGLPVALLEIQANGLPLLVSDVITEQVKVNDNYEQLPLSVEASSWAGKVFELADSERADSDIIQNNFKIKGFEIKDETKRLELLFLTDKG